MRPVTIILLILFCTTLWCRGQQDDDKIVREKILFYCDSMIDKRVKPAGFFGKLFRKGDCADLATEAINYAGAWFCDTIPVEEAKPGDIVVLFGYQAAVAQLLSEKADSTDETDTTAYIEYYSRKSARLGHIGILAQIDTFDYELTYSNPETGQTHTVQPYSVWIYDQNPYDIQLSEFIYPPTFGYMGFIAIVKRNVLCYPGIESKRYKTSK